MLVPTPVHNTQRAVCQCFMLEVGFAATEYTKSRTDMWDPWVTHDLAESTCLVNVRIALITADPLDQCLTLIYSYSQQSTAQH